MPVADPPKPATVTESGQSRRALKRVGLSFRIRIFLWFFGLLLALQLITTWVAYSASRDNVERQIRERMDVGRRLFSNEFQSRNGYLQGTVTTIAKDWGFRQAVGQRDHLTVNSVLNNHRRRIGADIGFYSNTAGDFIENTVALSPAQQEVLLSAHRSQPAQSAPRETVLELNNSLYQFVVVPVRAPLPIGWVGMGFAVDDGLATHFQTISDLAITFAVLEPQRGRVVASTLAAGQRPRLDNLTTADLPSLQQPHFVDDRDDILQQGLALTPLGANQLIVLMEKSVTTYFDQFYSGWINLLLLFLVALVAAGIVAAIVARTVTRPVTALLQAAARITSGDYRAQIDVDRRDEIGALALEFQTMQAAVEERESEIRYSAEHDLLTGLINREKFMHNLQSVLDRMSGDDGFVAVILLNLNRFKEVNNTLGHNIGDQLLCRVGKRLGHGFPARQVARHSADQFVMFQSLARYDELQQLCQDIKDRFSRPFDQGGIKIVLTSCLGVALYPEHGRDALTLLRMADVAMFAAREVKQDIAIYTKRLDRHSVQRLSLMSDLPAAIRSDQLRLYFQPALALQRQVPESSGVFQVAKVESLVRWQHPHYGFIPPDDFISLAEQTGAITDLTRWVLASAVKQCGVWLRANHRLGIAVNISASDLQHGYLREWVSELLQRYAVPSELLTLEITESEVMQDPAQARNILQSLGALGVRLSVDDYGTGYSSLAQLKQLPVNELKIDKSFVMNVIADSDDATIVKSTIDLGHTMGLTVVAEGIETAEALEYLYRQGCDYGQGYFIGKPMPAGEMTQWLADTEYYVASV